MKIWGKNSRGSRYCASYMEPGMKQTNMSLYFKMVRDMAMVTMEDE